MLPDPAGEFTGNANIGSRIPFIHHNIGVVFFFVHIKYDEISSLRSPRATSSEASSFIKVAESRGSREATFGRNDYKIKSAPNGALC